MVDRYPMDTSYDAAFREGRIGTNAGVTSGFAAQPLAPPSCSAISVGISPKRVPAHVLRKPNHFWEFAAGGNASTVKRRSATETVSPRSGAPPTTSGPTASAQQPPQLVEDRNPFELAAVHRRAGQRPPLTQAGRGSTPSPPPSHRSLSALTCACGTVFGSAPDSERSLGGFTVAFEVTPRDGPPQPTPSAAARPVPPRQAAVGDPPSANSAHGAYARLAPHPNARKVAFGGR